MKKGSQDLQPQNILHKTTDNRVIAKLASLCIWLISQWIKKIWILSKMMTMTTENLLNGVLVILKKLWESKGSMIFKFGKK
jgi:hypothetical protein